MHIESVAVLDQAAEDLQAVCAETPPQSSPKSPWCWQALSGVVELLRIRSQAFRCGSA